MSNTEKIIIFPKCDYKNIYLLIFIVASSIRYSIPSILEENLETRNYESEEYYKGKSYFHILSNFIGDFSVGIIILFNKCKKETNSIITTEGLKTKKEMKHKFYFYLSMIAIIDFLAQLCLTKFIFAYIIPNEMIENKGTFIEKENLYFVVLIDIISRYAFSRLFLKSYFYKHHIVSIFITILGFMGLLVINIYNIYNYTNNYKIFFLIQYIYTNIIYSLEDVLNKICLKKLIIRPYELMFYKALFQVLFLFIITLFDCAALAEYIGIIWKKELLKYFIYRLSFIISNIFRTWSLITIIEKISPNHLSVLKSSEFAFQLLFDMLYHKVDQNIIIAGIICLILSIFGSIIHNEIIIINKWGLLECTDYYKIEMKGIHGNNEDLEDNNNINTARDSLLTDSVDNE